MKGTIKEVFKQVVLLMADHGIIDLKCLYTDGTKIEANANRYSFVWGKSIKNYKRNISEQLEQLWEYTQEVAAQELQDSSPICFKSLDPDEVQKTIDKIDQALKDKPVDKKIKDKIKRAKKNWPENLKKYQQQEQILSGRNSYSKTDPDASFMLMKEDHLPNSQLKAAYNLQLSTNKQFIVNYTIHQSAADTATLKPHIESHKKLYDQIPDELIADAGYGSEENYQYLEQNNIEAYVKHNYFDKEQKDPQKAKAVFHVDNLYYNQDQNCYYCPMGQRMDYIGDQKLKTDRGFIKTLSCYQAQNCRACPIRGLCHKGQENRVVKISHKLNELKTKANQRLLSEKGINHRKQRPIDVEPVFGIIKQDKGFRRFMLRGLKKVNIEFGLLALGINLAKLARLLQKNAYLKDIFYSIVESVQSYLWKNSIRKIYSIPNLVIK